MSENAKKSNYVDVGVVFIRDSGKTYTEWYSRRLSSEFRITTLEEFGSQTHINALKVMSIWQSDKPVAVVRRIS